MKQLIYDIKISTPNPAAVDEIVQHWGAVVLQEGVGGSGPMRYARDIDGFYSVRCFGGQDFVLFALREQGYAKVHDIVPVYSERSGDDD